MALARAAVTRLGFVGSLVAMLGIGSHPIVAGVMHQCPCLFLKQTDSGSSRLESVVQLQHLEFRCFRPLLMWVRSNY